MGRKGGEGEAEEEEGGIERTGGRIRKRGE